MIPRCRKITHILILANTFLFLLTCSLVTQVIYCVDRNYSQFWKLHYLIYTHWAFWTSMEVMDFSWNIHLATTCHNNMCHHLAQNPLRISQSFLLCNFCAFCSVISELQDSKEDHINSFLPSLLLSHPVQQTLWWGCICATQDLQHALHYRKCENAKIQNKQTQRLYNPLGWNHVFF